MRCGHVPLDAHCRTAGSADLHCQEAFLVLRLLLFAFRSLCGNRLNRSRTRHHRNKPSWNQCLLVLFTIFALPPIVLVFGDSVAIQIFLLADVLLLAFSIDCSDFFSCHHEISIFCKGSPANARLQYALRRMLTHWSDAAEVGAELLGHKETPRNPWRISGSDIL